MNPRILLHIVFLLAVWLPVMKILQLEWRFNEQYHYGYFVPFFTIYLIYLRWEDRPQRNKASLHPLCLSLPLLVMLPLQLIQTANPDWRMVYWAVTLNGLLITVLWMDQVGGKNWVRHFSPALIMILFAVPWIMMVENKITGSLMAVVSAFTVEVLNLSGIYAVQLGNVIHLQGAIVGVEEACSGVRSLQSSLMAGYLFGEIMRFRPIARLLLMGSGVVVTFLLNLARTLLLTHVTLRHGSEAFEKWHDPIGNTVAVCGFLGIALLAWIFGKLRTTGNQSSDSGIASTPLVSDPSLSPFYLLAYTSLILTTFAVDLAWYHPSRVSSPSPFDYGVIRWDQFPEDIETLEIDPISTAQLKYSQGTHTLWSSPSGIRWTAFYFNWEAGNISSHAGVHRPENCLPASGIALSDTHETMLWKTPEGFDIPFRTMTFEGMGQKTYVFFAVWDENGAQPWISTSWRERFGDVWKQRMVKGRHSLQFLAQNAVSFEQAQTECLQWLQLMYPTPNH